MNALPIHLLLMLLGVSAVVSVVACLFYFIARFLEGKNLYLTIAGAVGAAIFTILLVGCALLGLALGTTMYLAFLIWLMVCSAVGGWFHRRSGGRSKSGIGSFCLMLTVAEMIFVVVTLLFFVSPSFISLEDATFAFQHSVDLDAVFAWLCFTAPMAVAVFCRLIQVSKLRLGLDHPHPVDRHSC